MAHGNSNTKQQQEKKHTGSLRPSQRVESKTYRLDPCPKCQGNGLDERGYPCLQCFGDGRIFVEV